MGTIPQPTNALFLSFYPHHRSPPAFLKWRWRKEQDARLLANRTRGQAFPVLVVSGKKGSNDDVVMVDPVEAKRLAAKQMERIKAKERLKRRRQIEAINGAGAMIGLTAGLVIEGQTGKSILTQLHDYLGAIVSFFVRTPLVGALAPNGRETNQGRMTTTKTRLKEILQVNAILLMVSHSKEEAVESFCPRE
ncbi:hypothetical protein VNO78_23264 [Psophocarpus tetragonolobus]|uniref:Uncharacterized protein n=1 Tax=Psophocarpus tetragonolobus TaxID=3891 RepID=A0AAN9S385_PSOTE